MNNYKVIPRSINKLSANEAYVYCLIKYYEDFKTHKSEVTEAHLAKISGISDSGIKKIVNRLKKEKELLRVETVQVTKTVKRNFYYFPDTFDNFFYVDNDFFKDNILDATEKGFLLKIKAICKKDTNRYWNKCNKSKLATDLNVSRPTLNKYLDQLIKKEQIKLDEDLFILNRFIYASCITNEIDAAYKIIVDKCTEQGITAPDKEYFPIANILSMWNLNSLEKHLNELPDKVNWEYITKSFGVRFEHTKTTKTLIRL